MPSILIWLVVGVVVIVGAIVLVVAGIGANS